MKIINVVGARPNFIKIAPILKEMKKYKKINPILLHTGQHYDYRMSDIFFKELKIPKPNINLNVGSLSHAQQTALIMERFEKVLIKEKPNLVLVVGDVNSTLACALTANKMHIKVAHVEAGMRSFDRRMPEEINRVLTDQLSDYLFTTQKSDNENLIKEGMPRNKIYFVGNVMGDTLLSTVNTSYEKAKDDRIKSDKYAVLTLHRQENVDDPKILRLLLQIMNKISKQIPIFFPVHPRARKQIQKNKINIYLENVHLLDPMGYTGFVNLYSNSAFVMTDSGGLQAETTILGVPCLTLRENTEWISTLSLGTNTLVGYDEKKILKTVQGILSKKSEPHRKNLLWDGKAAQRIVKILTNNG
jgi:UDP-N-acetylglucosamine 2-epimerase (non-hydrolysing)